MDQRYKQLKKVYHNKIYQINGLQVQGKGKFKIEKNRFYDYFKHNKKYEVAVLKNKNEDKEE